MGLTRRNMMLAGTSAFAVAFQKSWRQIFRRGAAGAAHPIAAPFSAHAHHQEWLVTSWHQNPLYPENVACEYSVFLLVVLALAIGLVD